MNYYYMPVVVLAPVIRQKKLTADGTDFFDILYFNPNIQPYKSLGIVWSTLREFCERKQYNLIIDKSYPY